MKDTLHFVLGNKEKYTLKEIMKDILNQKHNFIKKYNYEPKYIDINRELFWYISRQLFKKYKEITETIYGMEVITRDNEIVSAITNNEAICMEVK